MATGIVLGVLALGVLVAVVLLIRRSARDTLLPFDGGDPYRALMRRHGLSEAEADDISRGVARGRAFDDPRLRAAAAEWAATVLRAETPSPRVRRFLLAGVVVLLVAVVVQVVAGGVREVSPSALAWALFGVLAWQRRRNLRRAVERNGEVVPRE